MTQKLQVYDVENGKLVAKKTKFDFIKMSQCEEIEWTEEEKSKAREMILKAFEELEVGK